MVDEIREKDERSDSYNFQFIVRQILNENHFICRIRNFFFFLSKIINADIDIEDMDYYYFFFLMKITFLWGNKDLHDELINLYHEQ